MLMGLTTQSHFENIFLFRSIRSEEISLPCGWNVNLLRFVIYGVVLANLNESPSISVSSNEFAIATAIVILYIRYCFMSESLHHVRSPAFLLSRNLY